MINNLCINKYLSAKISEMLGLWAVDAKWGASELFNSFLHKWQSIGWKKILNQSKTIKKFTTSN